MFKVTIIDENNLTSNKIDAMVNYYIDQLFDENGCFGIIGYGRYWYEMIEDFIKDVFEVLNQDVNKLIDDGKHIEFDVFKGEYLFSFITNKNDYTVKKCDEMMVKGPDHLRGTSFCSCKELVPAYFAFLFDIDGFENNEINQLRDYKICNH